MTRIIIGSDESREESSENKPSTIRPFEWLTSPLSLKPLIDDSVGNATGTLCDHESKACYVSKKALHVGSGSSTVGEFLVEEMGFGLVVDVDKDKETLLQMKQRWAERCRVTHVDATRLEIHVSDFTKDRFPYEDNFYDLILDKSTLDCTLCSDNATASLLRQVYQSLAVGGVYILISFHELELLLPLIQDLPNACWDVTCSTLQRQVESISSDDMSVTSPTSTDTHNKKPLNVLIAKKLKPSDENTMSQEEVCQHVHHVNNLWFQSEQPLLTPERTEELKLAFNDKDLTLSEAYQVMFTNAEREHLTYDHFLEDWEAFVLSSAPDKEASHLDNKISYKTAIAFLTEMQ